MSSARITMSKSLKEEKVGMKVREREEIKGNFISSTDINTG